MSFIFYKNPFLRPFKGIVPHSFLQTTRSNAQMYVIMGNLSSRTLKMSERHTSLKRLLSNPVFYVPSVVNDL